MWWQYFCTKVNFWIQGFYLLPLWHYCWVLQYWSLLKQYGFMWWKIKEIKLIYMKHLQQVLYESLLLCFKTSNILKVLLFLKWICFYLTLILVWWVTRFSNFKCSAGLNDILSFSFIWNTKARCGLSFPVIKTDFTM